MKRRSDIYKNREKFLQLSFKKYNDAKFSQYNREVLEKWKVVLKAREISNARIVKLFMQMIRLNEWQPKDYNKWDKFDILEIAQKINDVENWSRATKIDYRRALKQFFRWFLFDSEMVEDSDHRKLWKEISNLKIEFVTKKVDENNIILENDLQVILDKGCKIMRDKAFISILHEAGLRIEEILNMRRSHIVEDGRYYRLKVIGKTGERTLTIVISVPYLRRYLLEHPLNNEPDYYIWVSLMRINGEYKPLDYKGAIKLIKRAMHKAEIKKPSNPHHFRHSRLTINGSFMTDSDLCSFAGWSAGSKCVQIYVHTTYNKVRDSILRMRGLETNKETKETTTHCSNCMTENLSQANFCACCGNPITTMGHQSLRRLEDDANKALETIMANPKLYKEFTEWRNNKENV